MAVRNKVLRALSVLTAEDVAELASADEQLLAFAQVAGGEWSSSALSKVHKQEEAKILSFPTERLKKIQEMESFLPAREEVIEVVNLNELSMDFILCQRELWSHWVREVGTLKAIEGYVDQLKLISIKETVGEGKEQVRFIATKGILINKKQA